MPCRAEQAWSPSRPEDRPHGHSSASPSDTVSPGIAAGCVLYGHLCQQCACAQECWSSPDPDEADKPKRSARSRTGRTFFTSDSFPDLPAAEAALLQPAYSSVLEEPGSAKSVLSQPDESHWCVRLVLQAP